MKDKIFIIANPQAGSMKQDQFEEQLERTFRDSNSNYELHYSQKDEDLAQTVRNAVQNGYRLIVAAGGDGTVSQVADGLQGRETPLAILPSGTGNVLAQELDIPLQAEEALQLLTNYHRLRQVDGMQVGDHIYLLHIGIGLTSATMESTEQDSKRRFGNMAYLWQGVKRLVGWQPETFRLEIDGRKVTAQAVEIGVTNARTAGSKPLSWGEDVSMDDGQVRVCIIRAKSILDYVGTLWDLALGNTKRSRHMRCFDAQERIQIEAQRKLPVQADGEMIGETPVEIRVVPQAVRIVVPDNQVE